AYRLPIAAGLAHPKRRRSIHDSRAAYRPARRRVDQNAASTIERARSVDGRSMLAPGHRGYERSGSSHYGCILTPTADDLQTDRQPIGGEAAWYAGGRLAGQVEDVGVRRP